MCVLVDYVVTCYFIFLQPADLQTSKQLDTVKKSLNLVEDDSKKEDDREVDVSMNGDTHCLEIQ